MRKFLLCILSLSFFSSLAIANQPTVQNANVDEDSFQQGATVPDATLTTVEDPALTEQVAPSLPTQTAQAQAVTVTTSPGVTTVTTAAPATQTIQPMPQAQAPQKQTRTQVQVQQPQVRNQQAQTKVAVAVSAPQTVQQPEAIDVNGLYKTRQVVQQPVQQQEIVAERPISETDRMKIMRARLEKQNEILIRKQMERMRLKQEMEMSKRIQKNFDDNIKRIEQELN